MVLSLRVICFFHSSLFGSPFIHVLNAKRPFSLVRVLARFVAHRAKYGRPRTLHRQCPTDCILARPDHLHLSINSTLPSYCIFYNLRRARASSPNFHIAPNLFDTPLRNLCHALIPPRTPKSRNHPSLLDVGAARVPTNVHTLLRYIALVAVVPVLARDFVGCTRPLCLARAVPIVWCPSLLRG